MLHLSRVRRGALALSVVASLAAAPAAFASGGSGGGGGGGGGGGSTAPAPTPTSSSCAKITSFSMSDRTNWGNGVLIQSPYAVTSSCSGLVAIDESFVNTATGAVDYVTSSFIPVGGTSSVGMLSWPGAPFSTRYQVTLTVHDYFDASLQYASQTQTFTTRHPQNNTV
jgi:hypothetical protein